MPWKRSPLRGTLAYHIGREQSESIVSESRHRGIEGIRLPPTAPLLRPSIFEMTSRLPHLLASCCARLCRLLQIGGLFGLRDAREYAHGGTQNFPLGRKPVRL